MLELGHLWRHLFFFERVDVPPYFLGQHLSDEGNALLADH